MESAPTQDADLQDQLRKIYRKLLKSAKTAYLERQQAEIDIKKPAKTIDALNARDARKKEIRKLVKDEKTYNFQLIKIASDNDIPARIDVLTDYTQTPLTRVKLVKREDRIKHVQDLFLSLVAAETDGKFDALYPISLHSALWWLGKLEGKDSKQIRILLKNTRTQCKLFDSQDGKKNPKAVLMEYRDYVEYNVKVNKRESKQFYFTVNGFFKFCIGYGGFIDRAICLSFIMLESRVINMHQMSQEERHREYHRLKNNNTKHSNIEKAMGNVGAMALLDYENYLDEDIEHEDSSVYNLKHQLKIQQSDAINTISNNRFYQPWIFDDKPNSKANDAKSTSSIIYKADLTNAKDPSIDYVCLKTMRDMTPRSCIRLYLVNYQALLSDTSDGSNKSDGHFNPRDLASMNLDDIDSHREQINEKYLCPINIDSSLYGRKVDGIVCKPPKSAPAWYWIKSSASLKKIPNYVYDEIYYDIPFKSRRCAKKQVLARFLEYLMNKISSERLSYTTKVNPCDADADYDVIYDPPTQQSVYKFNRRFMLQYLVRA